MPRLTLHNVASLEGKLGKMWKQLYCNPAPPPPPPKKKVSFLKLNLRAASYEFAAAAAEAYLHRGCYPQGSRPVVLIYEYHGSSAPRTMLSHFSHSDSVPDLSRKTLPNQVEGATALPNQVEGATSDPAAAPQLPTNAKPWTQGLSAAPLLHPVLKGEMLLQPPAQ